MTNRIKVLITGDASGYTAAAGAATRQTEQLEQRANGLSTQLGAVRSVAAGAAAVMGGVVVTSVAAAAKAIFEASAASQRLQTTLNFATGGRSVGELVYLRKVTGELGLEFQSTAVAYSRFQAAARGTALEGQKAREVFESVAKASAVMGLSADETSGVLLALQQMVSKGTVQAEELRGQLGERLPGAFQIAARAMGVTTAELGKMLEQGQVISEDFLPKFAKALNDSLGDAAENAANRLDASVNKFNTAWERMKKNVGDAGPTSAMQGQINILTDAMDDFSESVENARERGAGFFGQTVAAAGAVARFINPLQAFAYSANSTAGELAQAKARLAELQKQADENPNGPGYFLRSALAEAKELVAQLEAAAFVKRQLTQGKEVGGGRGDGSLQLRDWENRQAQQEQARAGRMAALATVTAKLSGVNENYLKSLQAIQAARDAGDISEARSIELLEQLAKQNHKVERATKGAKTEAQSFVEQLKRQVEELEAQAATFGLGETALVRYKAAQLGLSKEVDAYIKRMEAANRELAKQAAAEMQARDAAAWRAEQFQKTKDRSEQIKDLEREIDAIGRSEVALHALEQARLLDNAAALEAQAIRNRDRGYDDQAAALQKEADDLRKLAALREQAFFKRTTEDSRQALRELRVRDADEWDQHLDRVSQSFTDALFEGGKSGLDLLKGYARSSIIQMPAELVLKPIAGAARQLLNPGAVGSGSGGSGLLGNAATSLLGSSWGGSLASGAFGGGITGLVGSGLSSLGSALGWSSLSGFGAGLTGAGTLAGSTALSMGASGAAAGAAVSAAIPYVGLAVAIASMLGNRNKWSGQFGEASVANYVASAGGSSTFTNSKLSTDMAKGTASLAQSISDLSRSYGGAGDFTLRQFSATASKKDRAQAGTDLYVNGQYFTTGSTEVKKDQQAQAFADQALRATVKVLQETVAGRFGEYFDSVDAMTADVADLQRLIDTAQAVRTLGESMDWLGGEFDRISGLSVGATNKLATAAGGFDALSSAAQAAYQVLYTEQERTAFLRDDVAAALAEVSQAVPETTAAYRDALTRAREGMEQGAEGAETLYATLLRLAPAWMQVTEAARAAETQAAQQAEQQRQADAEQLKRLTDDIMGVQIELLEAQGRTAEAAAARRQLETAGLNDAAVAAYDRLVALRAEVGATQAAKQAAEELAGRLRDAGQQTQALSIDLLRAQGQSALADARQRELDIRGRSAAEIAIYDLNTALQTQIAYTTSLREAAAAAAEQMQRQAEEARRAALDESINGLQNRLAVTREALSEMNSLANLLSSSVISLYGEVASTITMQAGQGRKFITEALATAIRTGYLPDADGLSKAIQAARDGMSATAYATQYESDRDRLVLAGQLAQIDTINASKKSVAEQQLGVQEEQLEELQKIRQKLGGASSAGSTEDRLVTGSGTDLGPKPNMSGITATAAYLSANPDVAAAYNQNTYGLTLAEFVRTHYEKFGRAEGRLSPEAELRRLGIGSYAVGTNYVPQDMLAYVHRGEAIVPERYNPAAGGGDATARELARLNETANRVLAYTRMTYERLDDVTEGGNVMRTQAV